MSKPTFVVTDNMVEIHDIHPPGIVLLKDQVLELFNQVAANQPGWLMESEEESTADSSQARSYLQAFRKEQAREKTKKLEEDVQRLTVERDEYFAAYEAKHEALKQSEFERDMAVHAYTALRSALKDKEIDTKMGEIREALKDEG